MMTYCDVAIDISEIIENQQMKKCLELSAMVRDKTLDYCCNLPNYSTLSTAEKAEIYDKARLKFAKIYGLEIN